MIPDLFIYTGVANLDDSIAVMVQGAFVLSMILSVVSIVSFGTRLHLDRREEGTQ